SAKGGDNRGKRMTANGLRQRRAYQYASGEMRSYQTQAVRQYAPRRRIMQDVLAEVFTGDIGRVK
ncbi:MAG: hypothetical protein UY60_C0031G0001, partial [Parcubacteria group bacterium GW2011_GWB1_50_9]